MVLETLFCVGFFLTPLLGMVAMLIHAAFKATLQAETEEPSNELTSESLEGTLHHRRPLRRIRKKIGEYPIPRFENQKIFAYQLLEDRVRQKNRIKRGAHPRAGP